MKTTDDAGIPETALDSIVRCTDCRCFAIDGGDVACTTNQLSFLGHLLSEDGGCTEANRRGWKQQHA